MKNLTKILFALTLTSLGFSDCGCGCSKESILDVTILSYPKIVQKDEETIEKLNKALYDNGIVGIRDIDSYELKAEKFIEKAREFYNLDESIKEKYVPRYEGIFTGYQGGKEKFPRDNGEFVIDDLKCSYYGFIGGSPFNIWPEEVDVKTAFLQLGEVIREVGHEVMNHVGLSSEKLGVDIIKGLKVGRMLGYKKTSTTEFENPDWCGGHFDHGIITALMPARYYRGNEEISEPEESGLFIKDHNSNQYRKVRGCDKSVLFMQVGEFGQLATNDKIRATKHKVKKAKGNIERYTMAVFFEAPRKATIQSTSILAKDPRYGTRKDGLCSYQEWGDASYARYLVK